jgi:hypothetical protein
MTEADLGCYSPPGGVQPGDTPCPFDVGFDATGFPPDATYEVELTGPDINISNLDDPVSSVTAKETTGSDGSVGAEFLASTAYPPALGTYTVSMDGVSGTYVITAANQ